MRPRRRVAMYSQDEHRAGVLAYLLELRLSVTVTRCASAAEALLAESELTILVLSEREEKAGLLNLCERLRGASLVYDPQGLLSDEECAATIRMRGQIEPRQFLDQVRALLVRRRGPKRSSIVIPDFEHASRLAG